MGSVESLPETYKQLARLRRRVKHHPRRRSLTYMNDQPDDMFDLNETLFCGLDDYPANTEGDMLRRLLAHLNTNPYEAA